MGPASSPGTGVGPLFPIRGADASNLLDVEIEGYRTCANAHCRAMVLDVTAWQTRGVCFDCFVTNDMSRFREVEIALRADRHKVDPGAAHRPAVKRPGGKAKRRSQTENPVKADLARLRALRRMAALFPDVFAILYADERHKAGLQPKPHPKKDYLKNAVETYVAFAAYHAASDRSD